MNNAVNFLLESGISLALLSLIYMAALRKETFFRINRIFLLFSVAFSIVLPFLKFRIYDPQPVMLSEITVTPYRNLIEAVTVYGHDFSGVVEQTLSSSRIIILIYLAGLLFFLGRFIFRMAQIVLLIRKNQVQQVGQFKFVSIEKEFSPFSFLNYIFIKPENKQVEGYEKMVAHEMEHIKQGHTVDVLILETITILQWFNPFMWLLKRVIRENHEFLADQAVLKSGINPSRYKQLLLSQVVGFQLEVANNFNSSLIKNRIKMISKINNSKYGKLKILLGLLAIFSLLTAFAFEEKNANAKKKDKVLILNLDNQINRNTEELNYITGIVNESKSNEEAIEKLKGKYKLDWRYGVYNVSWKKDYKNGVFFIDGKEATYEEVENLMERNGIVGIGGGIDLDPFLEKYGDRAKNGVNLFYSKIKHDEIYPAETPVLATKTTTVQDVLDKYYKRGDKSYKEQSAKPVVVNVGGKQMLISGDNVSLEDVKKLLSCNEKYDISVLKENNIINLKPVTIEIIKEGKEINPEEQIFFIVEEMPEFPGGEKALREYIANNIMYPESAKKNGIQGKVYVTFVVTKDGNVANAKVARGVEPELDKEALRVVSALPLWKPGVQKGKPVNVSYTVPINFVLQ